MLVKDFDYHVIPLHTVRYFEVQIARHSDVTHISQNVSLSEASICPMDQTAFLASRNGKCI